MDQTSRTLVLSWLATFTFCCGLVLGCGSESNKNATAIGGAPSLSLGGSNSNGGAHTGGTSSSTSVVQRQPTCPESPAHYLTEGKVSTGYCAWRFAENLGNPRGILRDSRGQLLVVEATTHSITLLFDDDADSYSSASERVTVAQAPGLNHGIALNGGYLYASSDTTVYRWAYDGTRKDLGAGQAVVTGLPASGINFTRTLVFDDSGNLYVNIGSANNVDDDFTRSRVVRYQAAIVSGGTGTWSNFEAFADGTRNEVGLRFDSQKRLWGVENGSDDLSRSDLGGDIHQDNPAEELNWLQKSAYYGYPYCWSEGTLPPPHGLGSGKQWAYFKNDASDGTHTDDWCRDTANVSVPVATMQAHSAPLDLLFYAGGSFPDEVVGQLFVTFHGSKDRTPATGYKVVKIPIGADGMPSGPPEDFLTAADSSKPDSWGHRPVGLAQGLRGELFVTSDETGVVIAVGHNGT